VAWNPDNENRPITVDEFLRIVEQKYPGITRSPHLRNALYSASGQNPSIEAMLANIDPVRFRANARIKGYAKPLTDEQHTLVFKRHANVRTRHVSNPGIKQIARTRRNYGPGDQDEVANLFEFAAGLYISPDRPVIALRELIQNAADSINDPVRGSKALGQIGKNAGKIDVTFNREARTLTVEDNGCGMTPEVIRMFTTLGRTTKGRGQTWGKPAQTKEELEALFPPMQLTIRAYARPKEGTNPPQGGRYWIRINGLYQFDLDRRNDDRLLPSDYVFDYNTTSAVGGFGAAKAVIFLASNPPQEEGNLMPPQWELHTQDNYYDGSMAWEEAANQTGKTTAPVKKVERRQGTKLTIYNLDPTLFDSVSSVSVPGAYIPGSKDPIETRMKRVLQANDLTGITIRFNGEIVKPLFSKDNINVVQFGYNTPNWFDGIFFRPQKFPNPPEYLKDLLTKVKSNPLDKEYFMTKGRDAFNNPYRHYFVQFQDSAEIKEDDLKKKEDLGKIIFDPLLGDQSIEVLNLLDEVGKSPQFQDALAEAQKVIVDTQEIAKDAIKFAEAEKAREKSKERREQEVRQQQEGVGLTEKISEISMEVEEAVDKVVSTPGPRQQTQQERLLNSIADEVDKYLTDLDQNRKDRGMSSLGSVAYEINRTYDKDAVIESIRNMYPPTGWYTKNRLIQLFNAQAILTRASLTVGAGGSVASFGFADIIKQIVKLLNISPDIVKEAKEEAGVMNPLASMYGLIVMRGEFTKMSQQRALTWDGKIQRDAEGQIIKEPVAVFDEARYEKFTKNIAQYADLLPVWDQIVRLISRLYTKRLLLGPLVTGFVISDKVSALYQSSASHMVLIQPIYAHEAKKAYKNAADLAMYLHAMACHELAHAYRGVGHKDGHDEKFSIIREDLADITVGILPIITPLVAKWAKLRNPFAKESVKDLNKRYRDIAEEITCPACLKQAVETLEKGGRLDTVHWIKQQIGWDSDPLDPRSHDSIE
jgi:hypothetical protein